MSQEINSARIAYAPSERGMSPEEAGFSYLRGDHSIRAEIERAITRAPWLDADGVSVVVERGEVIFAGRVPAEGTRLALREIAGQCAGVRAVDDRLRVTTASDAPL